MSSFTIDKKEYVKVAGYIAGIAAGCTGSREFWLYDTVAKKNTDKELFYKRFVQCYEMNAESVREQYNDKVSDKDTKEYKTEFNAYFKKGRTLCLESQDVKNRALSGIQDFFHSALYQTENEKYNFMMTHYFLLILDELTEHLITNHYASENWGSFEAPESNHNYQIIA